MTNEPALPIRATLRNALTWAAAWAVAGGTITGIVGLFDPNPGIESLPERIGLALFGAVGWGVRFGIAGAVIGTLFSTAIRLTYRGRRLRDIDPVRFALLGAVVGGAGVPLYLQMMNLISGGAPLAWNLVSTDAVIGAVLGGAFAGGSIVLARRGTGAGPGSEPDRLDDAAPLAGLPADPLGEAPNPERLGEHAGRYRP